MPNASTAFYKADPGRTAEQLQQTNIRHSLRIQHKLFYPHGSLMILILSEISAGKKNVVFARLSKE